MRNENATWLIRQSIKVSYNPEFRSRVEIYERLGKSVILGGKKSQKADMRFVAVKKLRKVLVLLFIHILGQCINTGKSDGKF